MTDGILVVSEAHAVDVHIIGGYSTDGPAAVPTSAQSVVDVMRQEQRLRYLGFPGEVQTEDLVVDGVMDADTQQAIGRFCAMISGTTAVPVDEFTEEGAVFINAANAPRYGDAAAPELPEPDLARGVVEKGVDSLASSLDHLFDSIECVRNLPAVGSNDSAFAGLPDLIDVETKRFRD